MQVSFLSSESKQHPTEKQTGLGNDYYVVVVKNYIQVINTDFFS